MRVEVFDVVAGVDGIHRAGGHRSHVGHGADHVGLHGGVDVQPNLVAIGGC